MQYQVPQFIEIEDRIFAQLTLKQFLYLAGGAALCFLIWSSVPIKFIAIIIVVPIAIFFVALAFYKYNGRPFINTVENYFKFLFTNKLYIWKKVDKKITTKTDTPSQIDPLGVPKISDSKLKDLTWSLDINTKLEKIEQADKKERLGLKI